MGELVEGIVELEAMSQEDSSWYPCQVSLSSNTSTSLHLIVNLESQDTEDLIFTEEEALRRIRVRSLPLKEDDCSHIKQGDCVLASQNTRLFFDAEVEKAFKVRHSKRIHCRCTFEIKWLHPKLKGETMIVPSSSILQLAGNSINSHPVIAEFLNSLKTLNYSDVSSPLPFLGETDCEIDLHILLEKQIEEISNFAHSSTKKCSEEILLGFKRVDFKGRSPNNQVPEGKNNTRRSTRSQTKVQPTMDRKDLLPAQPSPGESNENRSLLTPLGARAALASLVYELPKKVDFSIDIMEEGGFNKSEKHVSLMSMDMTHAFKGSDISNGDKLFRRDSLTKSCQTEESSVMPSKQLKPACIPDGPEDKRCKISKNNVRLTRSAIQKKVENSDNIVEVKSSTKDERFGPSNKTRLTRSAVQKETTNLAVVSEDKKSSIPNNTRRSTRSTVQKETVDSDVEVKQELEACKSSQDASSDSDDGGLVVAKTKETKKKKLRSSPDDAGMNFSPEKKRHVLKTTERSKGETSDNGKIQQTEKNKRLLSSKNKLELRSSPRLTSLPRTRSQKKSSAA